MSHGCQKGRLIALVSVDPNARAHKVTWVPCGRKTCDPCWARQAEAHTCRCSQVLTFVAGSRNNFLYMTLKTTNVKTCEYWQRTLQRKGASWCSVPLVTGETAYFSSVAFPGSVEVPTDDAEQVLGAALRLHDRAQRLGWSRAMRPKPPPPPQWRLCASSQSLHIEDFIQAAEAAGLTHLRITPDTVTVHGLTDELFEGVWETANGAKSI